MNKLPMARSKDLVVQTLDKEVLIYDLHTNKAYNLNETSSIVFKACDGKTSFEDLKRKNKFTDDLIFLALDELNKENLIETDNSFVSPFNGVSRREAIRKVGLATMIALPVISSLVAPTALTAQSVACPPNACTCTLANICTVGGGCPCSTTTGCLAGCATGCSCTVANGSNSCATTCA
jgi:hypothetical protein